MTLPFFTIGHSNRSLAEFITLLRSARIERVVDIRKMPMSRANPQFNHDELSAALAEVQIGYEHVAALGGLRGRRPALPLEINGLWQNRSFHNYADYALSDAFRQGLEHLRAEGHRKRCAMMCAEAVWWRCHRRIVSDYLIAQGETVFHIMGEGRFEEAHLTPGAEPQPDGTVIYPVAGEPVDKTGS
ncbi:MAG: DUF488 domain-containing protein [Shinella zoogloeoides]|uniref:DUF488 domain-containing protein n=1 Tax=Shinella zoogloeoides TaxID=352475 RepID=UPI003C7411CA